jgi:hypothetical protein
MGCIIPITANALQQIKKDAIEISGPDHERLAIYSCEHTRVLLAKKSMCSTPASCGQRITQIHLQSTPQSKPEQCMQSKACISASKLHDTNCKQAALKRWVCVRGWGNLLVHSCLTWLFHTIHCLNPHLSPYNSTDPTILAQ